MTNQLRTLAEAEAERVIERPVPGDELDEAMWTDQVYNFIEGFLAGRTSAADAHLPSVDQIAEALYYSSFDRGQTYVLWPDPAWPRRETVYRQARAVRALFGEVAGDE